MRHFLDLEPATWTTIILFLVGLLIHAVATIGATMWKLGRMSADVEALKSRCMTRGDDCRRHFQSAEGHAVMIAEHGVKIEGLSKEIAAVTGRVALEDGGVI